MLDGGDRRGGVEGDAAPAPGLARPAPRERWRWPTDSAWTMSSSQPASTQRSNVGSGSTTMRWASKGTDAVRPAGGDDVGPEGEVGHEHAVHHVPLDAVDAGLLQGDALLAEPGEVGGEHRGDDRDRAGHDRRLRRTTAVS